MLFFGAFFTTSARPVAPKLNQWVKMQQAKSFTLNYMRQQFPVTAIAPGVHYTK